MIYFNFICAALSIRTHCQYSYLSSEIPFPLPTWFHRVKPTVGGHVGNLCNNFNSFHYSPHSTAFHSHFWNLLTAAAAAASCQTATAALIILKSALFTCNATLGWRRCFTSIMKGCSSGRCSLALYICTHRQTFESKTCPALVPPYITRLWILTFFFGTCLFCSTVLFFKIQFISFVFRKSLHPYILKFHESLLNSIDYLWWFFLHRCYTQKWPDKTFCWQQTLHLFMTCIINNTNNNRL